MKRCTCRVCLAECDGMTIEHSKACYSVSETGGGSSVCNCTQPELVSNNSELEALKGRIDALERDGGRLLLAARAVGYGGRAELYALAQLVVELSNGPLFYQRKGPLKP